MVESEMDEYNLNSNGKQQSLKISIIDNQEILILLTYKEEQKTYMKCYANAGWRWENSKET